MGISKETEVEVGQIWKISYGGVCLVLGVKDGNVLTDYRQSCCDGRPYINVREVGEFLDDVDSLVERRQDLCGLIPSDFDDIADFYYGVNR